MNILRMGATLCFMVSTLCLAQASAQGSEGTDMNSLVKRMDMLEKKVDIILDAIAGQNLPSSNSNIPTEQAQKSDYAGPSNKNRPPMPSPLPQDFKPGTLTPGWLVTIYTAPDDFDVSNEEIPYEEIGSFHATKSKYSIRDCFKELGMEIQKCLLWHGKAILYVEEPGTYTFTMNRDRANNMYSAFKVGGMTIARKLPFEPGTMSGAVYLDNGYYEIEYYHYNGVDDSKLTTNLRLISNCEFSLNIKTPKSSKPVPFAQEVCVMK